jgi:hypothetical protein
VTHKVPSIQDQQQGRAEVISRTFIRAGLVACAALLLSGCITPMSFVDPAMPKAGKADMAAVANPRPVQALYEFRTKGTANAAATQHTSEAAMAVLKESGAFSEVSASPVAGGRRLVITIDNVPITSQSDAMAKGFGTGLTFGLIGTMVTDGYNCEVIFTGADGVATTLSYKHAIHTTIGNASGPPGVTGQKPIEAARQMVGQLVWSALRDLGKAGKL